MARTLVPEGLRKILNDKLRDSEWTSVRNFCFASGLCTPNTYSAETITRVFNAREGEAKGTELSTITNVLRYMDVPMAEIRELLEHYYPDEHSKMFWSLLSDREMELSVFDRHFLDIVQNIETTKPEKLAGLISALESYTQAADIDCKDSIKKIKSLIKTRG